MGIDHDQLEASHHAHLAVQLLEAALQQTAQGHLGVGEVAAPQQCGAEQACLRGTQRSAGGHLGQRLELRLEEAAQGGVLEESEVG